MEIIKYTQLLPNVFIEHVLKHTRVYITIKCSQNAAITSNLKIGGTVVT